MECTDLPLAGMKLLRPDVRGDERGFFLEAYNERDYARHGIDVRFVQDNHSRSRRGVVRGLHFQTQPGQAKLVRVASGKIFDVAVDVRPGSATFGAWHGVELDATRHEQVFLPVGFAHGFAVLSDWADVIYKVSSFYDAGAEATIRFDDPMLGVRWPVSAPLVSVRDASAPTWGEVRSQLERASP